MREILFRGKRTDNGEWIEGYYIHLHKTTYCFKEDYDNNPDIDIHQIVFEKLMDWGLPNYHLRTDVFPETIGQYTGLTDKNGKRIFEGDICRNKKNGKIVSVKWHGTFAGYVWSKKKENSKYLFDFEDLFRVYDNYEIIGNIYDNPELLEGANNETNI